MIYWLSNFYIIYIEEEKKMAIVAIVALVLLALCWSKESKITGTFKALKAYGRITAYLALDFTMVGIVCLLSPVLEKFGFQFMEGPVFLTMLLGVVLLALGIFLYFRAYVKCPDFMKKKCIPCMIISGLGVAVKISLFFLVFAWKLIEPETMVTDNGEEVYVFSDGTVYGNGKVGKMTADRNTVVWNS